MNNRPVEAAILSRQSHPMITNQCTNSVYKISYLTRVLILSSHWHQQSLYTPWRRLGERRCSSYSFTTSALDGGESSASRPGRDFTPGERTPGTQCTGGWVGPRAGLDTEVIGKILCPRRGSNPDRPVVQPVVRHYTAWANPAPHIDTKDFKMISSLQSFRL
jgi:hypothetical protein